MATAEQILALRSMINQPQNAEPYTDDYLSGRIDAGTSLQSVAGQIWAEKASTYSEMVDIQEGSSRRSLGSLQTNALKMAAHYQEAAGEGNGGASTRPSRTRAIERP